MKGISLQVRAGEIVGIAGVDGNGQKELVEAITGLSRAEKGSVILNGEDVTNKPPRRVTETGLAHIPRIARSEAWFSILTCGKTWSSRAITAIPLRTRVS